MIKDRITEVGMGVNKREGGSVHFYVDFPEAVSKPSISFKIEADRVMQPQEWQILFRGLLHSIQRRD
jgi:hypothetical protein